MTYNQRNPYIVGTPVETSETFFGRESLLRTIEDSLLQNTKFILLHGQRRIGKSSVLKRISLTVSQDNFLFVYCDLQYLANSTQKEILHLIFTEIFQEVGLDSKDFDSSLFSDSENLLRNIRRLLVKAIDNLVGNRKLVLLLDEFDVVTYEDTEQAVQLLQILEDLVRREDELFVVAVVGRYLNSMPSLLQVFRNATSQEIGLLEKNSAEQLITQPANHILEYRQKAIEEIWKLTSGHPFYTQVLCYTIFQLATSDESDISETYPMVTDDVVEALPQAIESAEGGLGGFWQGLNIHERVVIATVAEAQESKDKNITNNPLKLLENNGLVITNALEEAMKTLTNKGFLDNNPIKVKVEIVRRWLRKRHRLRDEVRSLEQIEANDAESLLGLALRRWEGNDIKVALTLYEQVLQLNPNHFSNVVELAGKYLQVEDFDKALKLYARGYKVDAVSYKQELIQALEKYGHWLITQGNFISAKQQYEKILQIESNNSLAQQKLAEIKAFPAKNQNITVNSRRFVVSPIALAILGVVGVTGILFASFRVFNICLPIICVPPKTIQQSNNIENSISSGDRTLFPTILNSDRDQGIKSFKEDNYLKAEEYFKKAVNSQPNDPEVLIYQNNAQARQRGKPLTLAAVVPATGARTEHAQEVLRGIAQAQNDFNQKDGLNGRFLEIVIADHYGQIEQAEKVAQELVEDESLLGVIGHLSSGVTTKTLPIYAKANLPIISPTSTSTELKSPVFFRTVPSDKATGAKLAEYAFRNNLKKILIVRNPDDPYSRSITSAFREEFIRQFAKQQVDVYPDNITLPALENMIQEAQNITSNEQPVQAIVFFPDTDNSQNAIQFAKEIQKKLMAQRKNNNNVPEVQLLGGDSLYTQKALDVEGWILAVPWFRNAEKSKNFGNESEKRWGGGVSWRTATSFDAIQAFIYSFKESTTISKVTVLENLKNVNLPPDETSGEPLMFDKSTREIQRKATLLKVKNKKFVVIQ